MAVWWGIGQMIAGLVAWPIMAKYSCASESDCTDANNSGWRYTFYTLGSLVFILSLLRVVIIRLKESPKWLLSQNRDAEVIQIIQDIAKTAGKESPLTREQLDAIGPILKNNDVSKYSPRIVFRHIKGKERCFLL